jgi:hypothetical protein
LKPEPEIDTEQLTDKTIQLRIKNVPKLMVKISVGGVEQGIGISVSRQLRLVKAYKEMTEAKGLARSLFFFLTKVYEP